MRAFVAVFPPPEVQNALAEAAQTLASVNGLRPTSPEKVHLTLKFLGDVRTRDIDGIVRALKPLGDLHDGFSATTASFGAFPSAQRAKILWAGVGEGTEKLKALARDAEALAGTVGFKAEERPYVAHLTLGRARRTIAFDPEFTPCPRLRFTVGEVRLVESKPGGATYATLATFPLRTRPEG